jgi:hypothetical protein
MKLVENTGILAKLEYKNRTDVINSALTEYLGRGIGWDGRSTGMQ